MLTPHRQVACGFHLPGGGTPDFIAACGFPPFLQFEGSAPSLLYKKGSRLKLCYYYFNNEACFSLGVSAHIL